MMWMHGWGGYDGGPIFGMGPFMGLFWFLLLAFALWGVWKVLPLTDNSIGSALRTLEERFARGEIDKSDFEERRRVLRG